MSKLNKPRLGRGLSSLISMDSPDVSATNGERDTDLPHSSERRGMPSQDGNSTVEGERRILELPVGVVQPNPHQPRREFSQDSLMELAASLKSNGLIQPIVVRQTSDGFELIAGERRLRAAKVAGFTTISAIVAEADGLSQAQLALVENIQRENLNPIDRAYAYKTLLQQLGLSHSELALRLGEDRSIISNHLRLLELSTSTHDLIKNGSLTLGHAKVLAGVADLLEQTRLAELVASQGLSVRNLERLIQGQAGGDKLAKEKQRATPHIKQLEASLSRQLGMRVAVRSGKGGKGKVTISYGSLDEFDGLIAKLGVTADEE